MDISPPHSRKQTGYGSVMDDPRDISPLLQPMGNTDKRLSLTSSLLDDDGYIEGERKISVLGAGGHLMRPRGETDYVHEEEKIAELLPPLTRRQKLTILMLSFANFSSTVIFSCIAPFFPGEAAKKGMSTAVTGLVFGTFELMIFLTSPLLGKFMPKIGSKFMYCSGLLITSITIILFGLLNKAPDGSTFVALCFLVRISEAVGEAMFQTASMAIIAHEFPGRVAMIIGWIETFTGLGFTAGPAIGGALYQAGGFVTPFSVLGSLLFVAFLLSIPLIPNQKESAEQEDPGSLFGLVRIPTIMLMISAIFVCAICLSFLDPTLENFLADFNLPPVLIGLMFLLTGGVYTLTAPLWGYIIDKYDNSKEIMIFGACFGMISMFFLGPCPLLGIKKLLPLIGVCQAILGLGIGALFIPTFKSTLDIALAHGYPNTYATHGVVSGLFNSCFHLGGFVGPTLGSISVAQIGFAWSTTILSALNLCVALALFSYWLHGRYQKRQKKLYEKIPDHHQHDTSLFEKA